MNLILIVLVMADLLTFDAAQRWLKDRVNLPTTQGSVALAMRPDFPAQVRAHAFWSAKVSQANVLDALRAEVENFTAGKTDVASARARLKTFLSTQGYQPDNPITGDGAAITNLASTRRLNLILETNAGMAQAVGQWEVGNDPDVKERFPFWRYVARADARPTHAALDGLVLPKDDPFWKSHTPPWEWNCRCSLEDADAADAQAAGGVGKSIVKEAPDGSSYGQVVKGDGQIIQLPPRPAGGFVFRPDQAFTRPNWDALPAGDVKDLVKAEYEKKFPPPEKVGGDRRALPEPPDVDEDEEVK